ncbi:DUF5995 family protein [Sorangium sp. So ce131]|uniref:DUF5995 family protein n=1 Tax=Sorangium sp. So ce131 TaxID=3133282 RepID=UPI003F5EF83B
MMMSFESNACTPPEPSTPRRSAETLDHVIERLDEIAERSIQEETRFGYFAALYRRVTAAVRHEVRTGSFLDGPRMERFDVAFANRYFDALDRYRARAADPQVARSWRVAFDACARPELTILQHLYLGLDAHLVLDLGVAAAETCPGDKIHDLRRDFLKINDIVASLMREVDRDVGRASRWVGAFDSVAGGAWAAANNVVLRGVRELAWSAALKLARLDPAERGPVIERLDALAVYLAEQIAQPNVGVRLLVREVREREVDRPANITRTLQGRKA